MSKLFTYVSAFLLAAGAAFAGYVYYNGATLTDDFQPAAAPVASTTSTESGCPLCEAARKKRSCCDGEASARRLAFAGKTSIVECRSDEAMTAAAGSSLSATPASAAILGGSIFMHAVSAQDAANAAVLGGSVFVSVKTSEGCCELK